VSLKTHLENPARPGAALCLGLLRYPKITTDPNAVTCGLCRARPECDAAEFDDPQPEPGRPVG
jgi:hypothetical protein